MARVRPSTRPAPKRKEDILEADRKRGHPLYYSFDALNMRRSFGEVDQSGPANLEDGSGDDAIIPAKRGREAAYTSSAVSPDAGYSQCLLIKRLRERIHGAGEYSGVLYPRITPNFLITGDVVNFTPRWPKTGRERRNRRRR